MEPPYRKPILHLSHARACSTAFERIFIANEQHVEPIHEPFGDAYWMGPETQLDRYAEVRDKSGVQDKTYRIVIDDIERTAKKASAEGKHVFIKDMAFFIFPAPGEKVRIPPSLGGMLPEPGNPTLLPKAELKKFHFTFSVRHPRHAVPSYYRLALPKSKDKSKVADFNTDDAGYVELRRLLEYLKSEGIIGPKVATGQLKDGANGEEKDTDAGVEICVLDADDLMRKPEEVVQAYCQSTGIVYDPAMLDWGNEYDQERATRVIDRWGFHNYFHHGVLKTKSFRSGGGKPQRDEKDDYQYWVSEFGQEGADIIQHAVDLHLDDYNAIKQYAMEF
ncbi:hypothetical protein K490DRAFT_48038 [Saccharata proteae CBS 121410]|uniref:P-loop containing nucleoside triphosphate hydrolase protein n=1 Tax=Saccharata proteae CBS 121410 TaxID=1314787 RepID=A0A9P4HS17_9PEZI|nr:hypothetical protein K490DRAFT_48038 [Saccharata proteae CBS 121410]